MFAKAVFLSSIFLLPFASAFSQSTVVKKYNKLVPLPVSDVTITGGDFLEAGRIDQTVMLSLDPDRLLYTFRKNAGLPAKPGVQPYGGWEGPGIALRGHTTGHYLTALSYWYAQQPTAAVKQRIDDMVTTLGEVQNKLGNGYLSAFPETDIDEVERSGKGWAPHYTLHKLLQGLLDVYSLTGNRQALDMATRFGDWFVHRSSAITDTAHWAKVLDIIEQGGIVEGLLNLYVITGDARHKAAADFFEQKSKVLPAMQGRDVLNQPITSNYQHANATIPQFLGVIRNYELTGDKAYLQGADFFWQQVTQHRSFSNGSTGYHERWSHGADTLFPDLGIKAGETCCGYNMVKLSNSLFCQKPKAAYADYVERVLYNEILSSVHPETGGFMYFHTQQPGGFKTFGKNEEVFWCCTGTGMENHVRYAESIYFQSADGLYINLYIPSIVNWRTKGVSIRQETTFPESGKSIFTIDGNSDRYTLFFRVPYWAKKGIELAVNGKKQVTTQDSSGYVAISRLWKKGDVIEIKLPMSLHLQSLPDAPSYASVMYGPLVLAGELGRELMADSLIMTSDNFFGKVPAAYAATIPVPQLTGNTKQLDWLHKQPGTGLSFTTSHTSDNSKLRFVPVNKVYNQRFSSYWNFSAFEERARVAK